MGAQVSEAMKKARELIAAGKTPAEASREAGVTKGAISQDAECRTLIDSAEPGKLSQALQYVKCGFTAYEAAKEVGIHQSAISRSSEYKDYIKGLKCSKS